MRIFGGEKISDLMTRFNMPEDTPLTHPLVSKVIEQIQVKVEGFNFDIRKNLVEYDDVINKQRQIIYRLRDDTLTNTAASPEANWQSAQKFFTSEIGSLVSQNLDSLSGQFDYAKIGLEFAEIVPMPEKDRQELIARLSGNQNPAEILLEIINNQWQERLSYFGPELSGTILSYAIVRTLDPLWVGHLTALDDLRDGVRLRGYAQKDPLIEYRKEGYEMFQKLMRQFESNFARTLFRLEPVSAPPPPSPTNVIEGRGEVQTHDVAIEKKPDLPSGVTVPTSPIAINSISRNDPCWCGSGKKWKKCHYPQTD